jgi:2-methylcitrate dehydratase PrpD
MSLAQQLAQRIVEMRYEDLPPEAVHWCKVAVLDTVGVALAGSVEQAPKSVEEVMGLKPDNGPCLIIGSRRRASPLDAALVNGTSAHALDFDNTAKSLGGHASAVIVPALIAAGEDCGAGGHDLIAAHAAGFEVGAAVGRCVNPEHSEKGWHPTATIGVFAVTAACARLLKLTAAQTETALGLATSLAAGTKANFGTMTKPLHAGQCARGGLFAALLAREGFTANPDAFEHKQGFFNVFMGPGHYDAARALDGWGGWEIVKPGASYKLYPCCYSTHSAVEAALNLARRHGPFDGRQIARIDVRIHSRGLAHTDRADPKSDLEAKFSVQYCVARAALTGRVVLEHFESDAWREPAMRELVKRTHAAPYAGELFAADDPMDAEVAITLADGRTLSEKVGRPLGRTSDNPVAPEHLKAKFENCAGRVLAAPAVAAAYRALDTLERLVTTRDLTKLLEPSAAAAAGVRRATGTA